LLADIVSKNGNMLLNVVLYADGSLPPESRQFLDEMSAWMAVNGEAIYGTRPWKKFGEGPTVTAAGHFKENTTYTSQDIRFTTKGGILYAITLGIPNEAVHIQSLGLNSALINRPVTEVRLLGRPDKLQWNQQADSLVIDPPTKWPCQSAVVFAIRFSK
jgi:alpha-L-fucosidase